MSNTKSKSRKSLVDPFELGREAVHSVKQGTVKEAQESAKSFISQLLGIDLDKHHGATSETAADAKHGEALSANGGDIFDLAKHHSTSEKSKVYADKAPKHHTEAAPAIDYHHDIVKSREKLSKQENHEMKQNIEQIKVEIAKLVASSQELKMEFSSITAEQSLPNVGVYHINFFEWMLTVIRSARQKVEDSQSWMGAVKGKGAKRDYWGMFKKHGTTFGLSGERAVATQVG